MTSDEIEAAVGPLARDLVQIRASTDSACERSDHARVANPEAAHIVAKPTIPFRPTRSGKASHLVGAARVPGFRDNFYIPQDGILRDALEKRSVGENVSMLVSAQN